MSPLGGALMQLVAYGAQDVYLGGNYQNFNIKFRIYYKKTIINNVIVNFEIYKVEYIKFSFVDKNFTNFNIFDRDLKYINCENINLHKLPKFKSIDSFKKLTHFDCNSNKLVNIKKLMYNSNIVWLNCSINRITLIPSNMFSLEYFDFSNNEVIGNVNFSNYTNLKYLICSSNKIKSISNLPLELVYLDISDNQLENLDNLPSGLEYLLVSQTGLTQINLIELENLKYLDISINNLGSCVNALPSNLIHLNCSQSNVTKLDNLPFGLEKLICVNNDIKSLDMLPESLEYLDCDHNQITKLDNLPQNLIELVCSNNLIVELNNLPPKLTKLNCEKNKITKFTNLPKLTKFKYDDNIDMKNNSTGSLMSFFKVIYRRHTNFSYESINKICPLYTLEDLKWDK